MEFWKEKGIMESWNGFGIMKIWNVGIDKTNSNCIGGLINGIKKER